MNIPITFHNPNGPYVPDALLLATTKGVNSMMAKNTIIQFDYQGVSTDSMPAAIDGAPWIPFAPVHVSLIETGGQPSVAIGPLGEWLIVQIAMDVHALEQKLGAVLLHEIGHLAISEKWGPAWTEEWRRGDIYYMQHNWTELSGCLPRLTRNREDWAQWGWENDPMLFETTPYTAARWSPLHAALIDQEFDRDPNEWQHVPINILVPEGPSRILVFRQWQNGHGSECTNIVDLRQDSWAQNIIPIKYPIANTNDTYQTVMVVYVYAPGRKPVGMILHPHILQQFHMLGGGMTFPFIGGIDFTETGDGPPIGSYRNDDYVPRVDGVIPPADPPPTEPVLLDEAFKLRVMEVLEDLSEDNNVLLPIIRNDRDAASEFRARVEAEMRVMNSALARIELSGIEIQSYLRARKGALEEKLESIRLIALAAAADGARNREALVRLTINWDLWLSEQKKESPTPLELARDIQALTQAVRNLESNVNLWRAEQKKG